MTDNSTHLCGSEAPASTSDSPQYAVATPPKRVNLPLPREIRDQIYGYLLHHEFTEHSKYPESGRRDAGLPSSYKFHTNILAVNTEIGEEAREVLRSNDFVQVTTNWSVDEDLKALEVPIVCDLPHRNNHFDQLRIDYKLHVKSPEVRSNQDRKFVVVRSGLTKLCRFLQLYLLQCPTLVPVVLCETGIKKNRRRQITEALDKSSRFDSSIIVHDRIGKPLSEPAKRHLLEPFQNLIIGGQSMEINMMLPKHELAKFKLFMAPPVMNSLPMTWRLFELAHEMKAAADLRVLSGCITESSRLYRHTAFAMCNFPFLCTESETTVPDMLWDAGAWLGLVKEFFKRGNDQFQASFAELGKSVEFEAGFEKAMVFCWLTTLCGVAEGSHSGLQVMKHSFGQKKNFRAIMALHNSEWVADYFDHDVNYLRTLIPEDDDDETAAVPVVDKNKLSLFQLPPLIIDFPLPDGWSKPVDCFGFLDREMYEDMLSKGLLEDETFFTK
ncbi:hypothetical protein KC349_g975 [Hortaea werneckii]|nr:hypothetical protein KC349_g975 [Hortaea werneckii]